MAGGVANSLSFDGWVPVLRRQWSVSPEDERCLFGDLELSSPIFVAADRRREVHRAVLRLHPAGPLHPEAPSSHGDEEVVFRRRAGALFFTEVARADELVSAELTANIPAEEFNVLWERVATSHALRLSGDLVGATWSTPLELTEKSVTSRVENLRLFAQSGEAAPAGWAQSRQSAALNDALADGYFGGGYGNQVQFAVNELATSVAAGDLDAAAIRSCLEAIRELVGGLRTAFKAPLSQTPGNDAESFNLRPDEFAKAVASRGEAEAKKLRASYDHLWEHFNVAEVVRQGEAKGGATPKGFRPVVTELEDIAASAFEPSDALGLP